MRACFASRPGRKDQRHHHRGQARPAAARPDRASAAGHRGAIAARRPPPAPSAPDAPTTAHPNRHRRHPRQPGRAGRQRPPGQVSRPACRASGAGRRNPPQPQAASNSAAPAPPAAQASAAWKTAQVRQRPARRTSEKPPKARRPASASHHIPARVSPTARPRSGVPPLPSDSPFFHGKISHGVRGVIGKPRRPRSTENRSKPFRDGIASQHFLKRRSRADDSELIAADQHLGTSGRELYSDAITAP